MRILLVATFFPPQHAVASLRTHGFATEWARQGHEVTVLTTAKRSNQRGLERDVAGISVVEVPYRGPRPIEWLRRCRGHPIRPGTTAAETVSRVPDAGSPTGQLGPLLERLRSRSGIYAARRMPDLSDGWVAPATAWASEQPAWDLCVSSSGPYTPHLVARTLRSSGQVRRWVADFRDLWVDNHLGGGVWPFTVRERTLQRRCLETCDLAVTVTEGMASILRRSPGVGRTPVEVVHNGYDPDELDALDPAPLDLPADGEAADPVPGSGRRLRLVYTGSVHRHGQDASALFEAIARLHRDHRAEAPRFEVVVAGSPSEPWTEWARRAGVPEAVRILGVRPRAESLRLQRDADALLSVAWAGRRAGGLSGKIFEYLAWEPPIMVIGGEEDAPIVRLVRDCGRGRHAGSSPAALAASLEALAAGRFHPGADEGERTRITRFTRPAQARRLLELADEHLFGDARDRRMVGRRRAADEAAAVAPGARVAHRPA